MKDVDAILLAVRLDHPVESIEFRMADALTEVLAYVDDVKHFQLDGVYLCHNIEGLIKEAME